MGAKRLPRRDLAQLDERSRELSGPVERYTLTPEELAARYPTPANTARARSSQWRINRARNRALGIDRHGNPLPRVAGTNPRALGTNPIARGEREPIGDDGFLT